MRCGYCPSQVVFLPTVHGTRFCFDAMPITSADAKFNERVAWLPGPFPVAGEVRVVWAPRAFHDPASRREASYAWLRHRCPGLNMEVVS